MYKRQALDSGRYRVVSDPAELNGFDVAVITVPVSYTHLTLPTSDLV